MATPECYLSFQVWLECEVSRRLQFAFCSRAKGILEDGQVFLFPEMGKGVYVKPRKFEAMIKEFPCLRGIFEENGNSTGLKMTPRDVVSITVARADMNLLEVAPMIVHQPSQRRDCYRFFWVVTESGRQIKLSVVSYEQGTSEENIPRGRCIGRQLPGLTGELIEFIVEVEQHVARWNEFPPREVRIYKMKGFDWSWYVRTGQAHFA